MPKLQYTKNSSFSYFLRLPRITDTIPFLLIILAARCSILGIRPFAVSMFCGAFDLKTGYLGLAAVIIGFLSCGQISELTPYLISMLIFWLYSRLHENYENEPILSSVITGTLLFLCSITQLMYDDINLYKIIILFTESITCAFGYILFSNGASLIRYSRKPPSEQELLSGAVCIGIFISGLSGIMIYPGIELSKIISAYAVMCISLHMTLSVAGSCGVAAGLICSMNSINAIILTGLYGLAAIIGNMLKSFEKYGVALGFLGTCAIILLYIGDTVTVSVTEIIASCILFIITPGGIHKNIGSFITRTTHADLVPADVRMREYLQSRLSLSGHAFAKLASVYRGVTEKRIRMHNKDLCTVIDNTVKNVCAGCANSVKCMETEKANSYRIIFSALETLEINGYCRPSNAPREFTAMCSNCEIFLCELAHSYELYKKELIQYGENANNRNLIISQYEEISSIFMQLHDEIGNGFSFLPELEEKLADELIKSGCSLREIRVLENGISEIEVYIRLNRPSDKTFIGNKISDIMMIPMEFKGTRFGGMLKYSHKALYSVEYGEKQLTKGNELVSGDSLISFRTDKDKFYIILCDGMGSGSSAGKESRITGRLLEEFLKDGFTAVTAIGIINSSLAMNNTSDCFSSIDLLEINLITGNAEFYKIGSCKSFIKRGSNIETVFSPSLPAGIVPGIHISGTTRKLEKDDIIIMLSDGAEGTGFGSLSSERIKKIISDDEKTMNDLASAIIESSEYRSRTKIVDDMSVAAIRIKSEN